MVLNCGISENVDFQAIYRQREQWNNSVTLTDFTHWNVAKFPSFPATHCITPRLRLLAIPW